MLLYSLVVSATHLFANLVHFFVLVCIYLIKILQLALINRAADIETTD
jgi:hypothetical protein